MKQRKWYKKYRCRSCGAVCDPGELAGGWCFDCRDAAERRMQPAQTVPSADADLSVREQTNGQLVLEVR